MHSKAVDEYPMKHRCWKGKANVIGMRIQKFDRVRYNK